MTNLVFITSQLFRFISFPLIMCIFMIFFSVFFFFFFSFQTKWVGKEIRIKKKISFFNGRNSFLLEKNFFLLHFFLLQDEEEFRKFFFRIIIFFWRSRNLHVCTASPLIFFYLFIVVIVCLFCTVFS